MIVIVFATKIILDESEGKNCFLIIKKSLMKSNYLLN